MDSYKSNPEDFSKLALTSSFLKSRGNLRENGVGCEHFRDNRIRSCSFVKESKGGLKAVPFYNPRQPTTPLPDPNGRQSWAARTFSNKQSEHAGGHRTKSLSVYSKNAQRNLMEIPNFKPPYPNSSQIQFGVRTARDSKHYQTTYNNELIFQKKNMLSWHPGIEAFKNKWIRSRIQK